MQREREATMPTGQTSFVLLTPRSALAWEFWARGRRELLLAVLAGLTVPLVLRLGEFLWRFEWYRSSGQWGEKTSWPASVHLATLTVQTLTAVLMGWSIFVKSERHYALPVATRDLFLSRLVNGTAFVVAGMGIGTLLARLILWTDWPVATPALYAGVGWVAALWIGTRWLDRWLRACCFADSCGTCIGSMGGSTSNNRLRRRGWRRSACWSRRCCGWAGRRCGLANWIDVAWPGRGRMFRFRRA
jgi:hypothetical protein